MDWPILSIVTFLPLVGAASAVAEAVRGAAAGVVLAVEALQAHGKSRSLVQTSVHAAMGVASRVSARHAGCDRGGAWRKQVRQAPGRRPDGAGSGDEPVVDVRECGVNLVLRLELAGFRVVYRQPTTVNVDGMKTGVKQIHIPDFAIPHPGCELR